MTDHRQWAQTETQEVPLEHQESSTVRVTEHWNRLPRGVRESLCPEILKRPSGHDPGKPAVGYSSSA